MCLLDKKRFRFTFKRISIYKIAKVCDGELYSPYIGIPITRVMKPKRRWFPGKDTLINEYEFEGGFIHACTSEEDAKSHINNNFYTCKKSMSIIKGYIPAFTRYATDERGNICARKIILDI